MLIALVEYFFHSTKSEAVTDNLVRKERASHAEISLAFKQNPALLSFASSFCFQHYHVLSQLANMANLLDLPDELISMVCNSEPNAIPALRSTCRQLHNASFFAFLERYFTEITILAHPASIAVLDAVASDSRFNKAIRTLVIDPHGVFSQRMTESHDDLINNGIIRKQLAGVLSKLPKCTRVEVWRWDQVEFLGLSKIPRFVLRHRKTVYIDQEREYWMGSNGFGYPSYVMCDIIDACVFGSHALEVVDLKMQMEFGPLCDYIEAKLTTDAMAEGLKELSMMIDDSLWRGEDQVTDDLIRRLNYSHAWEVSTERTFFDCFPSLTKLKLYMAGQLPFLPVSLPKDLETLSYGEEYGYDSQASRLITVLKEAKAIRKLKLQYIPFETIAECESFLKVVQELPRLEFFQIRPSLSDESDGVDNPKLCFHPCVGQKAEHVFLTTEPGKDIPVWMESVRVCTCGVAGQDLVEPSANNEDSDPQSSGDLIDDEDTSDRSDDSNEEDNETEANTDADESNSSTTDSENVLTDYGSSEGEASVDYEHPAAAESQEVWQNAGVSRG